MAGTSVDPQIREESTHYVLPLVGREVDQLCIDYTVTLVIEGTDTIRLITPFTLHIQGLTHKVDPEDLSTVAVVLQLHRAVVIRAHAAKDGTLIIDFDDGRELRVSPDPDGESWEIGGGLPPVSPSYLIACDAGGGIRLGH